MNTTGAHAKGPLISNATRIWIIALAVLTFFNYLLLKQMYAGAIDGATYAAAYWFGTLFQIGLAILVLTVAARIGILEQAGKLWLLIGLAVTSYAVGDIVWTILDLHLGFDPYPSMADIFYTLEYVFFFWALVRAISSYKLIIPLKTPALIGGVIALTGASALYVWLLDPLIFPSAQMLGFWGTAVSTFYPVGDVLLMLAPAITLALVIRRLGTGYLAWPWWIVVASALMLSITDTLYSYIDWAGFSSNALLDSGWIVSNVLLAIGALVARDVYRSR